MKGSENRAGKVLLVDDESTMREMLTFLLTREGLETIEAESGNRAIQLLRQASPDLVLLDLLMPGMGGLAVLDEARKLDAGTPLIVLTGCNTIASAVEAVKRGAYDYVTKPFQKDDLLMKIRRALETRRLKQENRILRAQVEREGTLRQLMGPSESVGRLMSDLERVAPTDFTVVITGETGSGKELVARALHQNSHRAAAPFIPVDCGAIQPNLIESELFGHERGAFTGADRARPGRFELAAGGTLFLDEIQNLPLAVQTRFLRAIQERQYCRVGGSKMIDIDLRVVVATNENLEALIRTGKFRQDLFHRLNEFGIRIPPLRQRTDDILYLANRFVELTAIELRKERPRLSDAVVERLVGYPWPGNVRELRNVMRRAVLMCEDVIEVGHLGQAGEGELLTEKTSGTTNRLDLDLAALSFKERVRQSVMQAERAILVEVLRQTAGNKAKAARLLQIDYKTIRTKARLYGIPLQSEGPGLASCDEEDEDANGE